ncbi:MAG: class I SAM-dependent methyltransferase [Vicinamibacterales bacterium]
MATILDPAGKELEALFDAATFASARVLEIGSGNGRLALRYAGAARSVVGLESSADDVATAVATCSPSAIGRLRFVRGTGVKLPFGAATFEIALFGWSL